MVATDEPAFTEPVRTWEVEVRVNGTDILTIGSNHMCGINNIDDYADTVRMVAEHLLSFIGSDAALTTLPGEE